jgi:hypothetical protein
MNKIFSLCTFLFLISFAGIAQKKSNSSLSVDSTTHLITYGEVVQAANVSADIFYNRALTWFRNYYKNPGEVIRTNDIAEHKIVGKPRFKIYNPADKEGLKTEAGLVQYTITVSARNGRFKYELTEFNWKQNSYYKAERWMDKKDQSYTKAYDDYLKQVDEYVRALIADLKDSMVNEKPVKDKDKW